MGCGDGVQVAVGTGVAVGSGVDVGAGVHVTVGRGVSVIVGFAVGSAGWLGAANCATGVGIGVAPHPVNSKRPRPTKIAASSRCLIAPCSYMNFVSDATE